MKFIRIYKTELYVFSRIKPQKIVFLHEIKTQKLPLIMEKKRIKPPVLWTKIDIAKFLDIEPKQLNLYLSDTCKEKIKWTNGKQYFRDIQVLEILKDLFPAKNDTEIRAMIGY
jgi:hypothetical protein